MFLILSRYVQLPYLESMANQSSRTALSNDLVFTRAIIGLLGSWFLIIIDIARVTWRFWLGALSNIGRRGQRNREEIGAGASPLFRAPFCGFAAQQCSRQSRHATQAIIDIDRLHRRVCYISRDRGICHVD